MSTTTVANPDAVTITDGSGAPVVNRVNLSQPTPADATGPNGGPAGGGKVFTQEEVNDLIAKRETRDKDKLKRDLKDEMFAEFEQEQKKKSQVEQQEYKPLWEAAEAEKSTLAERVKEIEPLKAERDQLAAVVTDLVTQQREGLPDYVTELLDSKSPVEQLAWLNKNRETLTGRAGGPTRGVDSLPRPAKNVTFNEAVQAEIEAQRARPRR